MSIDQLPSPTAYPVLPEAIPEIVVEEHGLRMSFAHSPAELEDVQRLRFDVFNVELGEGLDESFRTGLDADRFDPVCHHLVIRDLRSGNVVGTYRMQVSEMAQRYVGFYTAEEFRLEMLPPEVIGDAVEVGRACVARDFRNRRVLFLLWKGLAAYLSHNRKRFLFGCCSLTSQDPAEGRRVMDHLISTEHVHDGYRVDPHPDWECYPPGFTLEGDVGEPVKLPKLFSLYLRYGAKACGPPALDRSFKTIDYLVLFDLDDLDEQHRKIFFGKGR